MYCINLKKFKPSQHDAQTNTNKQVVHSYLFTFVDLGPDPALDAMNAGPRYDARREDTFIPNEAKLSFSFFVFPSSTLVS